MRTPQAPPKIQTAVTGITVAAGAIKHPIEHLPSWAIEDLAANASTVLEVTVATNAGPHVEVVTLQKHGHLARSAKFSLQHVTDEIRIFGISCEDIGLGRDLARPLNVQPGEEVELELRIENATLWDFSHLV